MVQNNVLKFLCCMNGREIESTPNKLFNNIKQFLIKIEAYISRKTMNIMKNRLVLLCCCILQVMQVSASRSSSPLASMLNFAKTKYAKPKHAKTKSIKRKLQKAADVDKEVTGLLFLWWLI